MARTKQSTNKSSSSSSSLNGSSSADGSSEQLHGLDLSKYKQPDLVAALDRLTSFTYAGTLLMKPAMKIMWRSAFYQDADVRLNELLSKLKGFSPITEPPTEEQQEETKKAIKKGEANEAKKSQPKRGLAERIVHFFTVGLPLAIIVGLLYGVVNFMTCIWSDISTVASTSTALFNNAKEDLDYYMKHPESRPTKEEAIEAWTGQIIGPYTQTIVQRKLGPLGFISSPISSVVQRLVKRFAYTTANELEKYAKKTKGFNPFKPEAEASTGEAQYTS